MPPHTHEHHRDHMHDPVHNLSKNYADKKTIAQHNHTHEIAHNVAAPRTPAPAASLLRMSLAQRLTIAFGFTALIWLAVFWAMRPS